MTTQSELQDLIVLGVHRVPVSKDEFDRAVECQWGEGLKGKELIRAQEETRKHFEGLRLIEVQIKPSEAEIDWGEITQRIDGLPRDCWQVPWDEAPVDESAGRWAFYMHFVDETKPLSTPVGDRLLKPLSPIPEHLRKLRYELPG